MKSSKFTDKSPQEVVVEHAIRFLSNLDCPETVRQQTMNVIEDAEKQGLLSKGKPQSLAAGVIYIAGILCGDRMPLDAVAGVAKVSSSTVSKYYMKLPRGLGFQER